MIIEGIVTTEGEDGSMHVSPMGPWVDPELTSWLLKPFQTSTTFRNLHRTGRCIFHVTDDSLLMARAVLGQANQTPSAWKPAVGHVLIDSCRWFGLQIDAWDLALPRATAVARLIDSEELRPFFGWNRAKHAIVEAAILVSRLHMAEASWVRQEFDRLGTAVEKTAGPNERMAFELLKSHTEHFWSGEHRSDG